MSQLYNIRVSNEAIAHVGRMLPKGATNLGDHPNFQAAQHALSNSRVSASLSGGSLKATAAEALAGGAGNCGEQSVLAYLFLKRKGVRRMELVHGDTHREYHDGRPSDHSFVVLGRAPGSNIANPAGWGGEAVICDPWIKRTIPDATMSLVQYWGFLFDYTWQFQITETAIRHGAQESPF